MCRVETAAREVRAVGGPEQGGGGFKSVFALFALFAPAGLLDLHVPVGQQHLVAQLRQPRGQVLGDGDGAVRAAGAAHGEDQPALALLAVVGEEEG